LAPVTGFNLRGEAAQTAISADPHRGFIGCSHAVGYTIIYYYCSRSLEAFFLDIVITLLFLGLYMANQYSITVSNGADAVLKLLKQNGYKTSQCISALVETLGYEATVKLVTYQRKITWLEEEMVEDV